MDEAPVIRERSPFRRNTQGRSPALLEDRTDLTAGPVRFFVRRGVSIMPFFRKTEVSDADLDAIAAYLTRPRAASSSAPADLHAEHYVNPRA